MNLLVLHAAQAYGVPPDHVAAAVATPMTFDPEWLRAQGFTGDPQMPEHQAYLAARWLAQERATGVHPAVALTTVLGSEPRARTAYWRTHPRWWGRLWGAIRWRRE